MTVLKRFVQEKIAPLINYEPGKEENGQKP